MIPCNDAAQWHNAMMQRRWRTQPWSHACSSPNAQLRWPAAAAGCSSPSPSQQSSRWSPPHPGAHSALVWCCHICIFFVGTKTKCIFRLFMVTVFCWLTQSASDIASWSHDSIQQVLLAPRFDWRWLQVWPLTWSPGWNSSPVRVMPIHLWRWYFSKCYGFTTWTCWEDATVLEQYHTLLRSMCSIWEDLMSNAFCLCDTWTPWLSNSAPRFRGTFVSVLQHDGCSKHHTHQESRRVWVTGAAGARLTY